MSNQRIWELYVAQIISTSFYAIHSTTTKIHVCSSRKLTNTDTVQDFSYVFIYIYRLILSKPLCHLRQILSLAYSFLFSPLPISRSPFPLPLRPALTSQFYSERINSSRKATTPPLRQHYAFMNIKASTVPSKWMRSISR